MDTGFLLGQGDAAVPHFLAEWRRGGDGSSRDQEVAADPCPDVVDAVEKLGQECVQARGQDLVDAAELQVAAQAAQLPRAEREGEGGVRGIRGELHTLPHLFTQFAHFRTCEETQTVSLLLPVVCPESSFPSRGIPTHSTTRPSDSCVEGCMAVEEDEEQKAA